MMKNNTMLLGAFLAGVTTTYILQQTKVFSASSNKTQSPPKLSGEGLVDALLMYCQPDGTFDNTAKYFANPPEHTKATDVNGQDFIKTGATHIFKDENGTLKKKYGSYKCCVSLENQIEGYTNFVHTPIVGGPWYGFAAAKTFNLDDLLSESGGERYANPTADGIAFTYKGKATSGWRDYAPGYLVKDPTGSICEYLKAKKIEYMNCPEQPTLDCSDCAPPFKCDSCCPPPVKCDSCCAECPDCSKPSKHPSQPQRREIKPSRGPIRRFFGMW
jgi:hypothetical protein